MVLNWCSTNWALVCVQLSFEQTTTNGFYTLKLIYSSLQRIDKTLLCFLCQSHFVDVNEIVVAIVVGFYFSWNSLIYWMPLATKRTYFTCTLLNYFPFLFTNWVSFSGFSTFVSSDSSFFYFFLLFISFLLFYFSFSFTSLLFLSLSFFPSLTLTL